MEGQETLLPPPPPLVTSNAESLLPPPPPLKKNISSPPDNTSTNSVAAAQSVTMPSNQSGGNNQPEKEGVDVPQAQPLPSNYNLLNQASYKNLNDKQSYIMPYTLGGKPVVKTWNANTGQFEIPPPFDFAKTPDQRLIAQKYVENESAQNEMATKVPIAQKLAAFAPVQKMNQLQTLLVNAPDTEKPAIQKQIDALAAQPINSSEFVGTRLQQGELPVFQGNIKPQLQGGQTTEPFAGVLPDIPLPTDVKTVGDAYIKVKQINEQYNDVKLNTDYINNARLKDMYDALSSDAKQKIDETPIDQQQQAVEQMYSAANTPAFNTDKGFWYSYAKNIAAKVDDYVDNQRYQEMNPDERKSVMAQKYVKAQLFGDKEGDIPTQIGGMLGSLTPAMAAVALSGGKAAPAIFGADAYTSTKKNALEAYYYDKFQKGVEPNYNDADRFANQMGAIQGAGMLALGALGAGLPAKSSGLLDAAMNFTADAVKAGGRDAFVLGAGSKFLSDIVDKNFNVEPSGTYGESIGQYALQSGVLHILTHAPATVLGAIKPEVKNDAEISLGSLPTEQVDAAVKDGIANGNISLQTGSELIARARRAKEIQSQFPQTTIDQRKALELLYQQREALLLKEDLTPEMQGIADNQVRKLDQKMLEIAKMPLTDDEISEREKLKELQGGRNDKGQFENQLADSEKDRLEHLNKRYGTTTVDKNAPVGTEVSGAATEPLQKTAETADAVGVNKAPPTQVGKMSIGPHGEDEFSAKDLENGTLKKDDLTPKGIAEAKQQAADIAADIKSGKRPDINTVFHGSVPRTRQTAEIIAKELTRLLGHEVKTSENPDLDTWNIGKAEGNTPEGEFDEKAWADKDNGDAVPPGGESWNSFANRAKQAWDWLKQHPDNDHAIASSKMERMLSSLNESDGDLDKAKEIYFRKLAEDKIKENADTEKRNQAADNKGSAAQVQGNGNDRQQQAQEHEEGNGDSGGNSLFPQQEEGGLTGISHRMMQENEAALGISIPERGQEIGAEESLQQGREQLANGADPQKLLDDFNKDGKVSAEGVGLIRAKAEQLIQAIHKAIQDFGADSQQDKDARAALKKFQDDAKPYATAASNALKAYQGATDIDTGNFVGLRSAFEAKAGREATPAETAKLKQLSDEVNALTKKYEDALKEITATHDAAAKAQSDSETKSVTGKKYTAKAKEIADKIRTLKTKPFTFTDSNGEQIEFRQNSFIPYNDIIEAIAKGVEAGGKIADAVKEALDKYKDEDWYKNLSQYDKNVLADKLTEHITPPENDIHTQFLDKTDSNFTPKDVKAIWDYAKENYLDKGKTPQDMVRGVAVDLNLSQDQVQKAISLPKSQRTVTNDMYEAQRRRNKAVQTAKDYVEKAGQGPVDKFINAVKGIPDVIRNLATWGHGTVSPGTHSGTNLLDPTKIKQNLSYLFHTYDSAYGAAISKKRLEAFGQRVSNFQFDPMYTDALRHGVDVDATKKDNDYAPAKHLIGRLGQIGDRGFFELKPYRLELYKQALGRVPEIVKQDPTAFSETKKLIAGIVNNSTGSNASIDRLPPVFKGPLTTAVFAPKLVASHLARLITEPYRAGKTLLKMGDGTATPAERAALRVYAAHTIGMVGGYAGGLALNQGILSLTGSKQRINFTDTKKQDFLRFKGFDKTVDPSSGMVSMFKFLYHISQVPWLTQKEARNNRQDKMGELAIRELRGKASPFAGVLMDFMSGKDYEGNVMPGRNDRPKYNKYTGEHTKKLTPFEYALKHLTPIPAQEAQSGKGTASNILSGLISGITGIRVGQEPPKEKK